MNKGGRHYFSPTVWHEVSWDRRVHKGINTETVAWKSVPFGASLSNGLRSSSFPSCLWIVSELTWPYISSSIECSLEELGKHIGFFPQTEVQASKALALNHCSIGKARCML